MRMCYCYYYYHCCCCLCINRACAYRKSKAGPIALVLLQAAKPSPDGCRLFEGHVPRVLMPRVYPLWSARQGEWIGAAAGTSTSATAHFVRHVPLLCMLCLRLRLNLRGCPDVDRVGRVAVLVRVVVRLPEPARVRLAHAPFRQPEVLDDVHEIVAAHLAVELAGDVHEQLAEGAPLCRGQHGAAIERKGVEHRPCAVVVRHPVAAPRRDEAHVDFAVEATAVHLLLLPALAVDEAPPALEPAVVVAGGDGERERRAVAVAVAAAAAADFVRPQRLEDLLHVAGHPRAVRECDLRHLLGLPGLDVAVLGVAAARHLQREVGAIERCEDGGALLELRTGHAVGAGGRSSRSSEGSAGSVSALGSPHYRLVCFRFRRGEEAEVAVARRAFRERRPPRAPVPLRAHAARRRVAGAHARRGMTKMCSPVHVARPPASQRVERSKKPPSALRGNEAVPSKGISHDPPSGA